MKKTTMLVKHAEMEQRNIHECHSGIGDVVYTGVLASDKRVPGAKTRFIHDDTLPPGVAIGYHKHNSGEEYYYIVSGQGSMQLDGKDYRVQAGDLAAVYAGGSHGLINDSDEDLRILVFCVE